MVEEVSARFMAASLSCRIGAALTRVKFPRDFGCSCEAAMERLPEVADFALAVEMRD
jgi:hypothetical protein